MHPGAGVPGAGPDRIAGRGAALWGGYGGAGDWRGGGGGAELAGACGEGGVGGQVGKIGALHLVMG